MIAAGNGQNLLLADRFAAAVREQGWCAELFDLTTTVQPLLTPRAKPAGTPPALAALQDLLAAVGPSRRPRGGPPVASNTTHPAKADAIAELISRLNQLDAGPVVASTGG